MLYYYVYTGHKIGLDRLKRATAMIRAFEANNTPCRLLVNDFRAGLVARELGVMDAITIETIQDIDAVAQIGNSVIIDSPEDDHGRLEKYCQEFSVVFKWRESASEVARFSEKLLDGVVIDPRYEEAKGEKVERKLFFFNDADYEKTLLKERTLFEGKGVELLLGHYFFVKYEDTLAEIFTTLHEPEEYMSLIQESSCVITSSLQTAFEAKSAGACVYFLNLRNEPQMALDYLACNDIETITSLEALSQTSGCMDISINQLDYLVQEICSKL
jgi:hypothetical protein